MPDDGLITHRGGCHCGRVRFEIDAPAVLDAADCSCTICSMVGGYRHVIVARQRFRLLAGDDVLRTYTFNTGTAKHLFCSVCGVKSFYVPRSHPNDYSVSAYCLDPATIESVRVTTFDGRNWEAHVDELEPVT